jgi:Zn-dependent protease
MPNELVTFVFYLVVLLMSVVLHELAHGYAAYALGDDTAERAGRLTLNPLVHLDPVGSVLVPLVMILPSLFGGPVLPGFAWAKPVPFNPANLYKDRRFGPLKVALAGPATNLVLLLIFALLARFSLAYGYDALFAGSYIVALINASLGVLNLIPIPPFDGFRLIGLFSPRLSNRLEYLGPQSLILAFIVVYLGSSYIFWAAETLTRFLIGS